MSDIAPPTGLDARRAVQTVVTGDAGQRWFGSGYLVTGSRVLTAAHVLHGRTEAEVRFVDGPRRVRAVPAHVEFDDARADVAVLRLASALESVAGVRYGHAAQSTSSIVWEAVGYPRFKLNDDDRAARTAADAAAPRPVLYRDSHHAKGTCQPNSNGLAGTLELKPSWRPNLAEQGVSPWEGMSGAAVFADGVLIGIVTEHPTRQGSDMLTGSPAHGWFELLDHDTVARLAQMIGLPPDRDQLTAVTGPDTVPNAQTARAAARGPRRRVVLAAGATTVVAGAVGMGLWEERRGDTSQKLTGHTDGVASVAFSPDGRTVATGSWDRTIGLWDVATRRRTAILTGHTAPVYSVAFSPDGKALASGGVDMAVRIWSIATGNTTKVLAGHTKTVASVAFSPDGTILASGSWDYTARLWDPAQPASRASRGQSLSHGKEVNSVAFSPNDATLVTANWDWSIYLWDVSSRTRQNKFGNSLGGVLSAVFSPDGGTIASGHSDWKVHLWNVDALSATFVGHGGTVRSVAFSPDGKTVASAGDDKTVRLWDVATGTSMSILTGHSEPVLQVAFSPDGKILASASADKTVRLWSLAKV